MLRKLPALLLILASLAAALFGALGDTPSHGLPTVNNVTLFARSDTSVPALNGMVLSPSPAWTGQQISDAYSENTFTLYPTLGTRLRIQGTVLFRVWMKSDAPTFGIALFTLYEISVNGSSKEVAGTEGPMGISSRISDFNFAISGINATIEPSSTLQFRFTFVSSDSEEKAYLLWNDSRTPTQIVIPCLDHLSIEFSIHDQYGITASAYRANYSEEQVGVWMELAATDPFGLNDLRSIFVSVEDGTGNVIVDGEPMSLDTSGASFYSGIFAFNTSFPVGSYVVLLEILDSSGNSYHISSGFGIAYFYSLKFTLVDEFDQPLSEANYTITATSLVYATGSTNMAGLAQMQLPSSDVVGTYEIRVLWKNVPITVLSELDLTKETTLHLNVEVFRVTARCVLYGVPLSGASVSLIKNSVSIADAKTGLDGSVTFNQIPEGDYVITVSYLSYQYETNITVDRSFQTLVALEIPYLGRIPYIIMLMAAIVAAGLLVRRMRKPRSETISVINRLVDGGIPTSATIMIVGPSASGKTVLLENLMHASLVKGKPCVFIATMEFPSGIRKEMKGLGFDVSDYEKKGKLAFIDCYSAAAGQTSEEKYSVSSVTDLTRLGIEVSSCLESFGKGTEVFLDSLAPWVASLKPEFIVSFIHTTGAKVKAGDGKFSFTIGTSVDRELLTKLEDASDGIVELKISESEKEPRRRLAIRKFRGRKHSTEWIDFQVTENRGIVFRIYRRTLRKLWKGS